MTASNFEKNDSIMKIYYIMPYYLLKWPYYNTLKKIMSVNITQQTICRVISQQMLYFSQHFADKFCLENACCVMFTDICCHLTDMTLLGV